MDYYELFHQLKEKINYDDEVIDIDREISVHNFSFVSKNTMILPGEKQYECRTHGLQFSEFNGGHKAGRDVDFVLDMLDSKIRENTAFRYHVFRPRGRKQTNEVILLLHGFNEKYWAKYFPWAYKLARETGKLVVLFPIAFHMNRAPHLWSEKNAMYMVSGKRKELYPDVLQSTLSNVAISSRLHSRPDRFIWSGLQSYYDIIQFINECKDGDHPLIPADFQLDIFAYSIGCFLAQILKITDYNGYFSQSKLGMFCGGAVFNRLSPVSKYILDSEANVAVYSFLVEHLESHLRVDSRLRHYLTEHDEGKSFNMLLNYKMMISRREEKFRAIASQILAVTLEKDSVIPSYEVINTMRGSKRDVPVRVILDDFPYDYKHEEPFPVKEPLRVEVNDAFDATMNKFVEFFGRKA